MVVAGLAALTTTPAVPSYADGVASAACDGVTVIVDHGPLGGGTEADCRPAGDDADTLFRASGYELDYVQQQPTFICRVDGEPANNPCVVTPPQDAYWGLWWSDGESPTWRYATVAASGLSVPIGGSVALVWQDTADRVPPDGSAVTSVSSDTETPSARDDARNESGLPTWVGPSAVVVVALAAGVVVLLRRSRS